MKNALDVYDEIRADFSRRLTENPQLAERISGLSPDERGQFKKSVMDRYAAMPEYQVDTGIPDYTAADMFAGFPYGGKPTTKTLKRRLMPLEDEQTYAGLKELSKETPDQNVSRWAVAPEKLSEESRKNILAAAEAEKNSELIPLLKFDKKYLEQLEFARDLLYKDARQFQKDGTDWRNTWIGELARGFGSMTLNPANAAANAYRRARGGVPFGNPDKLTDDEIMERALDDAYGEMLPYLAGTKDFEDIRENVGWGRKISRGLGEIMGFATAGGNPVSLEGAAFAGGVKAASKLGAEKLPAIAGTAAKFGAGGAAAAAANIDVGTAVQPNEDIAGTLAKSMLAEAAGSAAFGAGLHTAIAGLSKAFFNQKNPLFKTVFESDIPAAAQYIRTLNERVANGAEIGAENRAVLETIMQTAKESGVDLDALAEGKIAPQYFAKVVRPWIHKIPYIGKMFPERMEGMRFVENKPLAGAKGEAFDAGAFRAKAAADVAASRPVRREGLMLEAQTPGQREAIVASFPRTPDGDLPFHIDGAQTHFGSAKEFSEWLFAADSGAREIYDRFENLPERDTIWRDEWLPAFAVKYGAKIDGMNADGRTFSAARSAANTRKIIDSIPDENVSDKLEAISAAEIEDLSDAHLEFAARHGEEWASEEILRRAQESLNAGLEADDVWSRADAAGEKIPSPQALRESGSDLAAEMDAIYGALPDNIKKKYFSASGGKLDETAQYLGYADENDLLDALAESARKFAEGGAPAAPKAAEAKPPKRAAKAPKSAPDKSAAPKGGESLVRRIDEDRARIAKRLASTPEEIIADFYRDYDWVDKTLKDAKKSGSTGVGLQNPDRAPIRLVAYPKTGKFRVVSGANSNVLKKFDSEEQARAFLKKWILKAAEVAKVLDYAKADALGVFADKRGLSSEDAYVRDAAGEIKVDGVVMRAAKNPDEVRESYRQWLEDERAAAAADARQLELLQERNIEGGDEEAVFAESAGEVERPAPSDKEIKEAQRQKAEVEAKWEKFGVIQKGKFYAPNGQHSNLAKEQWLKTRTTNFKEYFGDWESVAVQDFLLNNSVAEISKDVLDSPKIILADVLSLWNKKYAAKKVPGQKNAFAFVSKFVDGNIFVDSELIHSTISKGTKDRDFYKKNKALACVGEIIENGVPINIIENWKGRNYPSLILTAPITIENELYPVQVVITRKIAETHRDGTIKYHNTAYVVDAIKIGSSGNQHLPIQFNAPGTVKADFPSSIRDALREIFNVNKKNVSKVVDENGEPLVVYHGSGSTFSEFKPEFTGKGNDQYGSGFYFDTLIDVARGYTTKTSPQFGNAPKPGGSDSPNVVAAFLNIRNPIVIPNGRDFPNLSHIELTPQQAYEMIKLAPRIMDNSESPLGDFSDSYWSDGASNELIQEVASKYDWNLMSLEGDFFRGESTAFRKAANQVLGYDGVQVNFDNGEKIFVAWFPEQIKSASGNAGTYKKDDPNIYRDEAAKGDALQAKSNDPIPPDISGPRPGRFDARRLDETAHAKGYSTEESKKSLGEFLEALGKNPFSRSAGEVKRLKEALEKFTEKIDPRMLDLPELLAFAQNIDRVDFRVVKGFKGNWYGVYRSGLTRMGTRVHPKRIELRADLFRALGDLRRYELAEAAAKKTLEAAGYAPEAIEKLANADMASAIEANELRSEYIKNFSEMQHRALREAKKSGTPVAAIGVAAHEIMHFVDDIRREGTHVFDGGGTLGHLVGSVIPQSLRSLPIFGGERLTDALRASFRREAKFAAGKRPKKEEAIKRWNEFVSRYYNERVDEYCKTHDILRTDDARKELFEVVKWWMNVAVVPPPWSEKPEELYAEAGAAFLLNNSKFRELAPRCYAAMMAHINNHPGFAESWELFQRRLNDPDALRDNFVKNYRLGKLSNKESALAGEKASGAVRRKIFREDAKSIYRSENASFYDLVYKEAAERNEKYPYDLAAAYHNWRYATTSQEAYVQRFANDVLETLKKGGVKPSVFEEYMIYRRIIRERYDLANPFGLTAKTAIKSLRALLNSLSPAQRKALTQAGKNRQILRKKYIVDPLAESGLLNSATANIVLQNSDYATFRKTAKDKGGSDIEIAMNSVFGESLGGVISKQFGNLGAVKNVIEATLAKDLQIIAFMKRQDAMRNVVDIMKSQSPEWIRPADMRWDKERETRVPVIRENDHMATIVLMNGGAPDAYYVPKFIARPFLPRPANAALGLISDANSFTKMMLVQANAAIWPILHMRDLLKSMRVVSTYAGLRNMPRELRAYLRNLPAAYRAAVSLWKGHATDEALDALDRQMVVSRRNYWTGEGADIDEAQRLISEFGIRDSHEYKTRAERLSMLWNAFTALGQIFERASKISMKMYADQRLKYLNWSEAQKQQFVREQGGSPDFNERATRWLYGLIEWFTGNLFLNARKQGFASEITGMRQFAASTGKRKRRAYAEWTLHTLLWSSPGAFIRVCAALGAGGVLLRMCGCSEEELPDAEQMYWQIPEYDRLNKICIPLGRDGNGKTIYLRLPYGDFERYYGNLCTSFIEAFELEEDFASAVARFARNLKLIGRSEIGGSHPIVGTAVNVASIALGENPDDGIGRPIVDETAYKAGDVAGIAADTARYAYNNTMGSIVGRIKPPLKAGEPEPAFLEKVLSMPGISAALGRWIAVSDKGLDQLARDAARSTEKTSAQRTLLRRELAEKAADGTISDADFERLEGGFTHGDKQALRQQLKKIEARKNGKMDSILINYPARAQQEAIRRQLDRIGVSAEEN